MARWHAEHYMMRVEQRMQVSDMTHSVLAFNISGGCSTAGETSSQRHRNVIATSSQRPARLPTIDVRNLAL